MNKISSYYYFNIYLSNIYSVNKPKILKDKFDFNEKPHYYETYDNKGDVKNNYDNSAGTFIDVLV